MDCLLGIKGSDFVLLAADGLVARSIVSFKQDHSKFYELGENITMCASGDFGDTVYFADYIAKNCALNKFKMGYEMSPPATANFIRSELAYNLRRSLKNVNMLMGGVDTRDNNRAYLYTIDYLAGMVEVPFSWHGYGGIYTPSILDREYKPNLTSDQALELMKKSIDEIQQRFFVNLPIFRVHLITKDGVKELDQIRPEVFKITAPTNVPVAMEV